jgi:CubicO group peptidase (beta-lactamase class C family)
MGGEAVFESALAAVDEWPVTTAAAAVIGPQGVLASVGDLERTFTLASVTKPLAALAMLVAVEEEALDLNHPAAEDVVPGATLRHLLSHASGLAPERMMRSFAPGVRRVYSNVGIDRAGELVAEATGISFTNYFTEALVEPLALGNTSVPGLPSRDGISSVADIARVVTELLSPSGLLSPTTLADIATVQYPGLRGVLPGFGHQDANDWGLGFEIRGHKSPHWTGATNSPRTYGHFGLRGTMFWIDPEVNLGVVALADRDFGPWAIEAWPAFSDAVLTAYRSALSTRL